MIEAFLWGAVGASALLVGALAAYAATPSPMVIAVVMALGAGVLIGSVAFELIDEALKTAEVALVGLFTLVGAATFTVGDWWLDRRGAGDRMDSGGAQESGSPLAIVFGSVLDGVPESFVLGLTVMQGGVSVALLAGVLLSNLPEGTPLLVCDPEKVRSRAADLIKTGREFLEASWSTAAVGGDIVVAAVVHTRRPALNGCLK